MATNSLQKTFQIKNSNGTPFHDLVMTKATYESAVMSLGDKISGDVMYKDNTLTVTMKEYIEYEGIKYFLVNPPTIVREGVASANNGMNGMTKYSFVFYHPMFMLGNFPFTDIAVTVAEEKYLSQNKTFGWIGNLFDFVDKLNANLRETEWYVETNITEFEQGSNVHTVEWDRATNLSEIMTFDKQFISDALKEAYDTWKIPFVITTKHQEVDGVDKEYVIEFGTPSQEILDSDSQPFVFQFGQGVGLKNNSRTPTNNKIVTRIVGFGEERNITWGYPQIPWYGDSRWDFTEYEGSTINYDENGKVTNQPKSTAYPLYMGIYDGKWTKLIKHPFTRKTLMPYVYRQSVFNKISPYIAPVDGVIVANPNYNRNGSIVDYCDATNDSNSEVVYPNPINPNAPSVEIHEFEGVYPRLGDARILDAKPVDVTKLTEGVVMIQDMGSYEAYLQDVAESTSNSDESDAINALALYIARLNNGSTNTPYYARSAPDSPYQFESRVTPKGTNNSNVWLVTYQSPIFNILGDYIIKDGAQSTMPWDSSLDENNEYVQSYFKITLPPLGFDLYAMASLTEKMEINMRSGACIGCTFEVQINWDDYKANFFKSDGSFDPVIGDGHSRSKYRYPDSTNSSITLLLKKDMDTFGVLMPNEYQYPQGGVATGDKYVILGISLPHTYVLNAEVELEGKMRAFMLENNVYHYEYPVKFDEYFFATNPSILAQIKNNNIVRFMFGGEEKALYIKQISIKYGESVLPQYSITLTEEIEIVLNKIGQAAADLKDMNVLIQELMKNHKTLEANLAIAERDKSSGRFFYYGGTWTGSGEEYVVSDTQAPYFDYVETIHTDDGDIQRRGYWLFNPSANNVYTQLDMGTPHQGDGWEMMTSEFKYIITQAVFSDFAKLGSFIIKGNWMISQSGTVNGVVSTAYQNFDENYPDRNNSSNNNFVPYFAVNGQTGRIYAKSGAIGGFAINQKDLVNVDYDAGITIRNQYNTKQVQIGSTAIDPYTNRPVPLFAKMIDTGSGGSIPLYNTALYLESRNATNNYAFHGYGNGVLNGYMQGFKVHDHQLTSSTPVQIKLSDGMIQTVSKATATDLGLILPELGEVMDTLAIQSVDVDFCCELIIVNQTEISRDASTGIEQRRIVVYGDTSNTRRYTTQVTARDSLPIILRQTGELHLNIEERCNAHFFLTYINKRYIANYIYG